MKAVSKMTVPGLIDAILCQAREKGASDIHIEMFDGKPSVRYRIDGRLQPADTRIPSAQYEAAVSRIKAIVGMDAKASGIQDGRKKMEIGGTKIVVRAAITPTVDGPAVVLRLLDSSALFLNLATLKLPEATYRTMKAWLEKSHGLIVVGGPTGSGKTTTLYAMLQELNKPDVKIASVEDPVEYQIDGINQIALDHSRGITQTSALRAVLRSDPDVILLGEVMNFDSAEIAVKAAITGHLVLTSMHNIDGIQAIRRLLTFGIEPFLLGEALVGVVSQVLVRRNCKECKVEYKPGTEVPPELKNRPGARFVRGKGCAKCHGGYRGRVAIQELLEVTPKLKDLVARNAGEDELRKQASESGLVTLREAGLALAFEGVTTVDEVLRMTAAR